MHRPTVGILSLILLAVGTVVWLGWRDVEQAQQWIGACWRVGFALGALWLALPDLSRLPTWILVPILAVAVLVARQPRIMLIVIVAMVLYAWLRPRLAGRSTSESTR